MNEDTEESSIDSIKTGPQIRFADDLPKYSKSGEKNGSNHIKESDISNKDYLIAALLVKNAQKGRVVDFKLDEHSLKYYQLYYNRWYGRSTSLMQIIFLYGLYFCEWPSNREYHDESQSVSTARKLGLVLELICLAFFFVRFYIHYSFEKWDTFKKDPKNYVLLLSLLATCLGILIYWSIIAANNGKLGFSLNIHYAAFLRPLIIINSLEKRQIRRVLRNIRRTVVKIIPILLLTFMSVLIFALLCFKLYNDEKLKFPNGDPYFTSVLDSFWQLWILTTTSNSPDVMLPAYVIQQYYMIVYVVFYVITVMLLFPIMLAITMDDYKKNLKSEVKRSVMVRRNLLNRAFDLIATPIDNAQSPPPSNSLNSIASEQSEITIPKSGQTSASPLTSPEDQSSCKVLSKLRWITLLRFIDPKLSRAKAELLFCVLEGGCSNYMQRCDFLRSADLLNVRLSEVKDRLNFFDINISYVYDSKPSLFVRAFVKSKAFSLFFSLVIVANTIYIFFEDDSFDWIFLVLYMIEIVLKIYTKGFLRYFSRVENLFDFSIIFGAAIIFIATHVSNNGREQEVLKPLVEVLMTLRILRLVKGFRYLSSFAVILRTIISVMPSFFMYGSVLLLIYYEFALLGIHLFRDKFYLPKGLNITADHTDCGNPALKGSEFAKLFYCRQNFNNGLQAMITLFTLMVVNQWHVISEGHTKVTTVYARIYFMIFGITCMVLLNVFLAFVVEVFILEYRLSRTKHESAIETKIKEMGLAYEKSGTTGSSFLPSFFWHSSTGDIHNISHHTEASPNPIQLHQTNNSAQAVESNATEVTNSRPRSFTANVEGVKFHLKKRGGKSIELLLQSLFEDQIDLDDPIVPKTQNLEFLRFESINEENSSDYRSTVTSFINKNKRKLSKIFSA